MTQWQDVPVRPFGLDWILGGKEAKVRSTWNQSCGHKQSHSGFTDSRVQSGGGWEGGFSSSPGMERTLHGYPVALWFLKSLNWAQAFPQWILLMAVGS